MLVAGGRRLRGQQRAEVGGCGGVEQAKDDEATVFEKALGFDVAERGSDPTKPPLSDTSHALSVATPDASESYGQRPGTMTLLRSGEYRWGGTVRKQLRDDELNRELQRVGWVVVPGATMEQVAETSDVYLRYDSGVESGYYATIFSKSNDFKADINREVRRILWPRLDELLEDHKPLVGAMMVKPAEGASVVPAHQDWNVIDESKGGGGGLTCWFPLTPITDLEGKMRAVPGSHRYLQHLRGSPCFPTQFDDIVDEIVDELMVPIDVEVGEVLIMDGRVLHMTPQNESGKDRPVAYISAAPAEERPVHYYFPTMSRVEGYKVDDDFFTRFHIGNRPWGELFEQVDEYSVEAVTMGDVRRMYEEDQATYFSHDVSRG